MLAICLFIILTRSFYFANSYYIQYDEAWNYNYFLAHNPVYTIFAYNNYPLHNLVSSFFLTFLPANTVVLRLPSILIGIFSCLFVFAIIQKIWNNSILSLCAMCLFACLPITVLYMMYARGVILELFFSWIIIYFINQFFKSEITFKEILFLGVLNALGVYSMLSHLYFIVFSFLAILIFVLMTNTSKWKYAVYYFVVSILCSSFLIFPFMLGTGISLGTDAAKSSQNLLTLHILPFHAYSDMMGGVWFIFYLLIGMNVFLLFKEKSKKYLLLVLLNLALLLSPLLIYFLSNTFPPERAFAFIAISTIMTFALVIQYFKITTISLSSMTFLIVVILSISTYKHNALNWSKEMDKEAYVMFQLFDKNEISNVYNESDNFKYYVPSLIYYFSLNKKEFHYSTNEKSSTRYIDNMPSNTQCIVRSALLTDAPLVYQFDGMYFYFLK
ncbi:MAG: glycosyltransferase family 39 protein [Chitinophagaceae bacterium]|nr:glycosyltransferase family 39 protein [Chitinophagaceae bacterium]